LRYEPREEPTGAQPTAKGELDNGRYVIYSRGFNQGKGKLEDLERRIIFEYNIPELITHCMHRISATNTAWKVPTGRYHIDKTGLAKNTE